MSAPAFDARAWRDEGIRALGYSACAALFPTGIDPPVPKPALAPVSAVLPSVEARGGRAVAVQREMPFLAALDRLEPSLPRARAREIRMSIDRHPGLIDRERRVLRYGILPRCRAELHAWPGHRRLALDTGLSERTVARALDGLRRKGAITCQHRGRRSYKGGRTSNHYGIQLSFFFGHGGNQPVDPNDARGDSVSGRSARVRTPGIAQGGEQTRNHKNPPHPPPGESTAESTPVRHGGDGAGTGPPCPRCGTALTIQREPEGIMTFCLACGFNGGIKHLHSSAQADTCRQNVATSRSAAIRSRSGVTPVERRRRRRTRRRQTQGNPGFDRQAPP